MGLSLLALHTSWDCPLLPKHLVHMPDFSYIYPIITRSCATIPHGTQIKIISKITRKITVTTFSTLIAILVLYVKVQRWQQRGANFHAVSRERFRTSPADALQRARRAFSSTTALIKCQTHRVEMTHNRADDKAVKGLRLRSALVKRSREKEARAKHAPRRN